VLHCDTLPIDRTANLGVARKIHIAQVMDVSGDVIDNVRSDRQSVAVAEYRECGGIMTQLPGDAFDPGGNDVAAPAVAILGQLNLLPSKDDLAAAGGPGAVLGGPPQSVVVIEAGATALSKWWAGGAGVTLVGVWGSIVTFWNTHDGDTQRVVLWAAAIVSAAIVLGIAYVIASDLGGRANASVATIAARRDVATAVVNVARSGASVEPPPAPITPLNPPVGVTFVTRPANDESGWKAIAIQSYEDASKIKFLVVKGLETAWAPAAEVSF
jgi:hypothetical protein